MERSVVELASSVQAAWPDFSGGSVVLLIPEKLRPSAIAANDVK